MRLLFVPTNTSKLVQATDFDPDSLEIETNQALRDAGFYDSDLEKLTSLEVEDVEQIWAPDTDVTYQVVRVE